MKFYARQACIAAIAVLAAGCAGTRAVSGGDGTIKIKESPVPAIAAPGNSATVRVLPYVDGRNMGDPRKIGVGGQNILGLHAPTGNDILLNREVAAVVTDVMKLRMRDAGYQVVEDGSARFEMRGTVRELSYDVKARDEVAIAIETELKDVATGKVLWDGVVSEKQSRFAGVGGDDIADVAAYLRAELGIVTQKTANAITGVVAAQHPELFNVAPGTKPVAGVTVLNAASAVPPAAPAPSAKGVLKITTKPARAKIYIGGVYYGLSPLRLELEPGVVDVTAELEQRKNASEKVSVRKGETTELELTLKK